MMNIINADGEYEYEDGTKTLKQSAHPVYQARVDLALGQGTWCYAPSSGHDLAKYATVKQTSGKIEEFQKELQFYLKNYGPSVTQLLVERGAVSLSLQIDEDALNG